MQEGSGDPPRQPGLYGAPGASGGARSWESPPPPPSAPPHAPPPHVQRTSGLSVAALVVGIVALCLLLFLGPFVLPVSIVAVILGALGIRQCDQNPEVAGKGMGVAGLVMGIIASVAGLVVFVFFFWIFQEIAREIGMLVPF